MLELNVNVKEPGSFSVGNRIDYFSKFIESETARYLCKALFEGKIGLPFKEIRLLIHGAKIFSEKGYYRKFCCWSATSKRDTGEINMAMSHLGEIVR